MNFDVKTWLENNRGKSTLLGICPMSEEIVKATLQEAREKRFIPMFIATPRQVDADRGYTGWSQKELVEYIRSTGENLGYSDHFLVARDHGGPYQSMRDRDNPEISLNEAMDFTKETFYQDLKAGFDIIHVDATEDPRIDEILNLEEVVDRTAELIVWIEDAREKENLPPVYYEVGTEEITGGITEPEDFELFIQKLVQQLEKKREDVVDRLIFIVGQVGTTMRIDMTNSFDREQAKTLVDNASSHDFFLKVHYTDWLGNSKLEQFPELGIGAANVGPEFAAAIVEALFELEKREKQILKREKVSQFGRTIKKAAIEQAPWKKFVPKDREGKELKKFAEERRTEIAYCVGRYVTNNPEVKKARQKLYENLKKYDDIENPNDYVIENIRKKISRYIQAFNLERE